MKIRIKKTMQPKGYKHSKETRELIKRNIKISKQLKGIKIVPSPNSLLIPKKIKRFYGNIRKFSNGYFYIEVKGIRHPRAVKGYYVRRADLVAEKYLGRLLKKAEVVHHINSIRSDDRPENLYVFNSNSEHIKYHRLKKKPALKSNLIKERR